MKKYLLIPVPKNPYNRIGSLVWQDWYRQVELTVKIARQLRSAGNEVIIAILSNFQPQGQPSEIETYTQLFNQLAPELNIRGYRETNDTLGQVERSFEVGQELGAEIIFISTWMHYLRIKYLARGHKATHYGAFGIPQPVFAFIDPFCLIFQPLVDQLGLSKFFQRLIVRQREKGRIL